MSVRPRFRRLPGPRAHPALAQEDAVHAAGELVAAGRLVALDLAAAASDAGTAGLAVRVVDAGLAAACEVTVAARTRAAGELTARGLAVALTGPPAEVDPVARALPGARVVVPAGEPWAEDRCRALAGGRVRLVAGRGAGAELSFVRCVNILMAGDGEPAVATTDPRLIAITGERAAWNGRSPDSWEHVMPWGEPTDDQSRLLAAGHTVRVLLPVAGGRA
ncbi:hypothetical protein ABC795_15730 [Blastococcus sp. HT6-30]|uniref:hypothetical protein n=1 Tax=Blastococcus sp. HT6-30 TaxID=3144843 RepID=UPI003219C5E5